MILKVESKTKTKTKTKKPLFYLDNIFNNLLSFNMVQTKKKQKKHRMTHNNIQNKQLKIIKTG